MKKIIALSLLILTGLFSPVLAAYLKNVPMTVMQPNGVELHCFATGDEFYNWLHDANGFTIMQHPQTGYYVYAEKQGDSLVATNYVAGNTNPINVGLKPYLNISAVKREAIRSHALSLIPENHREMQIFPKSSGPRTLNNIVIYIRFSDQIEYTRDTSYYWNMFNNLSPDVSSMRRYYQAVSYNKVDIISHFYPRPGNQTILSYQDINPRSYYMPYDYSTNPNGYRGQESTTRKEAMLKRAIQFVISQIPSNVNFDYDGDGNVDNICFIVKGATGAWSNLLWPHRSSFYVENISINGLRVKDYNFQIEADLNERQSSVLCHEMFHTFGSPDLYKYSDSPMTPIGYWDLMANNATPPQSMCAYLKNKHTGWVSEVPEITKNGFYTLKTVWNEDKCIYKIKSPNSTVEYFTVEYRKNTDYFDQGIPGSGLLIYRINPLVNGNGNSSTNEIYIFRPNASDNNTEGTLNSAAFSANMGRTEFNNNTNPPCFLTNDQAGGISIRNIGAVGDSITFEVIFPTVASPDFKASKTVIAPGCSVDFTNLTAGYVGDYIWTFDGASTQSSTEKNPTGIVYNTPGNYKVQLMVRNQYGDTLLERSSYITVTSQTPNISMHVSDTIGCSLDTIQFFGRADACPQSWSWSFSPNTYRFVDGTSSSSKNPKVLFEENTSYSASLIVSNVNGNDTLTKSNIVSMGGFMPTNPIAIEDFDDVSSLKDLENKGWKFYNEQGVEPWTLIRINMGQEVKQFIGVNLTKSDIDTRKKDWLISPAFKLTEGNYTLSFRHFYCLNTIYSKTDSLNIYITTDCGENWTLLGAYGENGNGSFVTRGYSYESFTPVYESDWCQNNCIRFDLSAYTNSESVKFKFEIVRYGGNNLFLDDIKLQKKLSIPADVKAYKKKLTLYPNPTKGIFTIYSDRKVSNAEVIVYNVQGSIVYKSTFNGERKEYNLSHLSNGIYFVKINGKEITQQLKFVKQ